MNGQPAFPLVDSAIESTVAPAWHPHAMATDHTEHERPATHRWIVVADSGFLPPRGGGEREHAGFVRVAFAAGYLAALVVPTDVPLDLEAYTSMVGPQTPIISTARKMSPLRLVHPRHPYVVASRPFPRDLVGRVRDVAPDATGVVTFSYKSRQIGEGLATALDLPMVVRQHNREGDYHRSLASGMHGPRRMVMTWEAWRIGRDERRFDRSPIVTAIADISADDAAVRRAAGSRPVVHVPPFAFDVDADVKPSDSRRGPTERVVFLGALDVVTNQSALAWFTSEVWPLVRQAYPTAVLDVVGSRPPETLRQRLNQIPGTELHANVPSVEPFLSRADVAVNPAVTGSGVNIKLVDYLQAGVPVVSTALATRGLDLRPGVDLEVHDNPTAFAAAVIDLLRDPHRADEMAASGHARCAELLDPRRNLDRLAQAFRGNASDDSTAGT